MLEQSDDFHFEECKKVESHGRNNDKNYKVSSKNCSILI